MIIVRRMLLIASESFQLIKKHKYYFLLPTLLALVAISFLFVHIGPAVIISFIYAGI